MNLTLTGFNGSLEIVCVKCTRFALLAGVDRRDAEAGAVKAGWVTVQAKPVCPKCSRSERVKN